MATNLQSTCKNIDNENITPDDNNHSTILSITDLHKEFRIGKKQVQVLVSIDLKIFKGEFVCIIGGSGCGKSTLLRIIAGLDIKYSGFVLINGRIVRGPGVDRGLVFQEHRLFPWLNVEQNIAFGIRKQHAEKYQTVKDHINLVGLQGFEKLFPHQLSGGMAQRTAIARAIVNKPEILLMDEPFGALDAFTKIQMHEEIKRIRSVEKTTVILVTHDMDEAIFLADRVVVMSNRPGKIRKVYSIDLPDHRDRHSPAFVEYRRLIFNEFFAGKKEIQDYAL
ncbi:MAG TPA: ABC transporter ATP-binding protein [Chitinispirillaceae bacterium]|nr:ABC transporter ATP-binding protein [Chitinispirillaceae bacterium]